MIYFIVLSFSFYSVKKKNAEGFLIQIEQSKWSENYQKHANFDTKNNPYLESLNDGKRPSLEFFAYN